MKSFSFSQASTTGQWRPATALQLNPMDITRKEVSLNSITGRKTALKQELPSSHPIYGNGRRVFYSSFVLFIDHKSLGGKVRS